MGFDPSKLGARCDICPRRTQKKVPPEGPRSGAKWVWWGQDPGANETRLGRPFVGPTGARITRIWDWACKNWGISIPRYEVLIINAACCEPITPSQKEAREAMVCCRPFVLSQIIKRTVPDAGVLLMGKGAFYSATGREKGVGGYNGYHLKLDLKTQLDEARFNVGMLAAKKEKTLASKRSKRKDH